MLQLPLTLQSSLSTQNWYPRLPGHAPSRHYGAGKITGWCWQASAPYHATLKCPSGYNGQSCLAERSLSVFSCTDCEDIKMKGLCGGGTNYGNVYRPRNTNFTKSNRQLQNDGHSHQTRTNSSLMMITRQLVNFSAKMFLDQPYLP